MALYFRHWVIAAGVTLTCRRGKAIIHPSDMDYEAERMNNVTSGISLIHGICAMASRMFLARADAEFLQRHEPVNLLLECT